jgi:hypothetical protein
LEVREAEWLPWCKEGLPAWKAVGTAPHELENFLLSDINIFTWETKRVTRMSVSILDGINIGAIHLASTVQGQRYSEQKIAMAHGPDAKHRNARKQ